MLKFSAKKRPSPRISKNDSVSVLDFLVISLVHFQTAHNVIEKFTKVDNFKGVETIKC